MSGELKLIVHICPRPAWREAIQDGQYHPASLDREGFIHCSAPGQVLEVANRFYRDIPDLVLLWIDPRSVAPEICLEAADGDLFPHIYGPLNLEAVIAANDLFPDAGGVYRSLPPAPVLP